MKASWKSAKRKPLEEFTMRDVDAMISEVRAERGGAAYRPVKLSIALTREQATWLKRSATSQNCSVEELIMNAVVVYSQDRSNLAEDKEYFTKAIAESTPKLKTGRYEK